MVLNLSIDYNFYSNILFGTVMVSNLSVADENLPSYVTERFRSNAATNGRLE